MASAKRSAKINEFVAHGSTVNCLAFGQSSGRVMVTGGDDKKVHLWAVGKPDSLQAPQTVSVVDHWNYCELSVHGVQTLSGHMSPVESVRFDPNEAFVAAGSLSGALKIWDLNADKIVRTLTGHKASIRCLDFMPIGSIFVSGSLDSTIRLWDMRQKGYIHAYKGHPNGVNCLRFSPDGKWVASGGEDSALKVWDVTMGRQIADLVEHTGAINSLEFHPGDVFVATGSSDRTARFWDMDSMRCIGVTDSDTTPIRCVVFHPEGRCLYALGQDSMRVHCWGESEPPVCVDSLHTGWGSVTHAAIKDNQLVGASFHQTNVSVYFVDITQVQPLGGPPYELANQMLPPLTTSAPRRRSFMPDQRPPTHCGSGQSNVSKLKAESDRLGGAGAARDDGFDDGFMPPPTSDLQDLDYQHVFNPTRQFPRGPPSILGHPFTAPVDNGRYNNSTISAQSRPPTSTRGTPLSFAVATSESGSSPERGRVFDQVPSPDGGAVGGRIQGDSPTKRPGGGGPGARNRGAVLHRRSNGVEPREGTSRDVGASRSMAATRLKPPQSGGAGESISAATTRSKPDPIALGNQRPFDVDDPTELNADDFLVVSSRQLDDFAPSRPRVDASFADFPGVGGSSGTWGGGGASSMRGFMGGGPAAIDRGGGGGRQTRVSNALPTTLAVDTGAGGEDEALALLGGGHRVQMAVLSNRLRLLQAVASMWASGNVKMALDAVLNMNDLAVFNDVVKIMLQKDSLWTLDMSALLLGSLQDLVVSKYESYVQTGLGAVKLILRSFAPLIKQTIGFVPAIGVDLSREERYNKCATCHKCLMTIRDEIARRVVAAGGGKRGGGDHMINQYREILLLIGQLD